MYANLFSPLPLGGRTAPNRIVSSSHSAGFTRDGVLSRRYVDYHVRKAEGGVGLLMTFGSASVHPRSAASYGSVSLWDPRNDDLLRALAERAHEHGSLVMSQATHMGRRGSSQVSGVALGAPADRPEGVHREIPHVLTTTEVEELVDAFAHAARRLHRFGWDGIEITSFGGHLIEQFWSPRINTRTDKYGGSAENRMRFGVEVLQAVSSAVPDDFVVGFRMTGDPRSDALGLDTDDMLEIAARLDALDCVHFFGVSGGTGATPSAQAVTVPADMFPRATYEDVAAAVRKVVSVPVAVAGRYLHPDEAEAALAAGKCDLVAMTRAIIADPDLPRNARAGRVELTRPCIATNEDCIGRLYTGSEIHCSVNPAVHAAGSTDLAPTQRPRHVVVIGAGPAGAEAARVLTVRGHRVTVLERDDTPGGQVRVAAKAPHRPSIDRHVDWLAGELRRLQVDVRFGVSADAADVLALSPDTVVVATGAASVTALPTGSLGARMVTDEDLLEGRTEILAGQRVVVYDVDGRHRGATAALHAADHGAQVELATPLAAVAAELDQSQFPPMRRMLAQAGVATTCDVELAEPADGALRLRNTWSEQTRTVDPVDVVVFTGFRRARSGVADELRAADAGLDVRVIGDALAPRRIEDAVKEAFEVGRAV